MDIYFINNKVAKLFNTNEILQKKYDYLANKIQQRLYELKAVNNLSEISHLPPTRRHKLGQNRKDQYAVDLNGKFRLVFKPCNDPIPFLEDGGIDLTRVTKVVIIEVTNYHNN